MFAYPELGTEGHRECQGHSELCRNSEFRALEPQTVYQHTHAAHGPAAMLHSATLIYFICYFLLHPRDNRRFGVIYCSVTPRLLPICILSELQKQLDIPAFIMCFRCCYYRKKSNPFCSYMSIIQWNWKAQRYCERGTTVIVTRVWRFIVKPRNT